MQIFNLELRKIGDSDSLLKEVDSILLSHGMVSGQVSIKVANETAAHSLQKMFKKDQYFDVCTVKNCASATAINISSARQAIYSAAHCIRWGDMTDDYKQILIAMVMDDFRSIFESPKTLIA